MSKKVKTISISQIQDGVQESVMDEVVVEEPLEIRLVAGPTDNRRGRGLSITMRTPGNDFELAIGFLVSEGIVRTPSEIDSIEYCGTVADGEDVSNIVRVELSSKVEFQIQSLQRHFYTTSSCGVCGKASLEALQSSKYEPIESAHRIERESVFEFPRLLRDRQELFSRTGGIHAAGLIGTDGRLISVHEDVGRHNAVDKLIGEQFLQGTLPLADSVLVVSGRASFELLQKTLAAGIPIFVAVGAPSSLACELANQFNITLIGFTSEKKFNIYSHGSRVVDSPGQ